MKHTKRTLSLLLAFLCLFCFTTGCKNQNKPSGSPPDSSSPTPHLPVLKEIEITLDNWDTYFEFVERDEEFKDDYNETVHIQHYYTLDLKEQYTLDEINIKIEYSYLYTDYKVQEDLVNKKIIWGDPIEGPIEETVEKYVRYDECPVAGEAFFISGSSKWKCTDFKVLRIYGTLTIIE